MSELMKADPQSLYCWHCDLGLKKDRAALAMAHHSGGYVFGQDGQPPIVTLDLLIYWQARNGLEIRQVLLSAITRHQGQRRKVADMSKYTPEVEKQIAVCMASQGVSRAWAIVILNLLPDPRTLEQIREDSIRFAQEASHK